jgi:hypothetical protein
VENIIVQRAIIKGSLLDHMGTLDIEFFAEDFGSEVPSFPSYEQPVTYPIIPESSLSFNSNFQTIEPSFSSNNAFNYSNTFQADNVPTYEELITNSTTQFNEFIKNSSVPFQTTHDFGNEKKTALYNDRLLKVQMLYGGYIPTSCQTFPERVIRNIYSYSSLFIALFTNHHRHY